MLLRGHFQQLTLFPTLFVLIDRGLTVISITDLGSHWFVFFILVGDGYCFEE